MGEFDGKKVVVTGGSRGIGEAIAKAFASSGATVGVLARNLDGAQTVATELGGESAAWSVDVSDEASVTDAFGSIVERFGTIDVLVNNAGITRDNLLMRQSAEDWDQVLGVNLKGTFLCSRAVLRPMLRARSGRIINVTSVIGLIGNPGQGNYSASKAGIIGFTKSLAKEVASRTITVNAIAPGLIDTDMTRAMGEEVRTATIKAIPLARFGGVAEVAQTALFLASEGAAYITGETIRVDGGMAM